ncbi:MAG: hypothetical protein EZS28_033776 [Streblomastix strix]|uniref:Uncharacterized protein n=1 Tax=Streblomastix strix TaxID=222440 RepID=A0A5J4UJV8_9EUKA|nr:MAG: hypothetical protein EZS28_033776 [Streblomastix strix]
MIDRNQQTKSSEFLFNKQSSEPKTEQNKDVGTDSKLQKKQTDIQKRIASMKQKSQSFMVSAKPKLQQQLQQMHQQQFSQKGQLQLKDQLTQKILLRRLNMQIQPFRNLTEKKIQRSPFIISARNPSNNPFKQQHSQQRTYDENTANDLQGNTMKGSKASTSKQNRRKRKQRRRDGSSPRKPKIQTFERFNPGLSNRQINALNYMPHVSQNTMPDLNQDEFSQEYTIMSLQQPQQQIMSIPLEQDMPNIIKNRSLIIDSMKKLEGQGDKQMQQQVENEGPAKVPKSLFHFVIGSKTQITADQSQQSTFSVIGTDLSSGVITSQSSEISLSQLKEIKNKIKIDKENEKNRDRSNSGSKMGYIDSIQDQSTMDENMDFLSIQEQFSQKGSAILGKNGSLPSINIVQNKSSSLKQLQSYQDSPSQPITKRAISQPNSQSMLDPLSRPFTVSPQQSNMFNHSSSQPSLISHKTVTSHNSQKSHISFQSHTSQLTFQSPVSRNSLSPVLVQSPEVMDPQLIRKLSHSLSETMSKEEEELIQKTIENELQKEPKNVLAGTEQEQEKSMTVMTDARQIQVEDLTQDLRQSQALQTPIHLTPTYQTPSHLTPTFSTPTNLTPMQLGNQNSIQSFTQFSLQDSNLFSDNDGYNNNNEYNIKQPYQFTPLNPNMVKKQQLSYINEISYPTYVSDQSIDQDKVKSDNTQSNSFGGVEILEDTLNKFEAKTNQVRLENQQEVRLEKQQEQQQSSETEKQKSVFSSQFLAVLQPTIQTPQKQYRNLSSPDSEHLQFKIPSEITTQIKKIKQLVVVDLGGRKQKTQN